MSMFKVSEIAATTSTAAALAQRARSGVNSVANALLKKTSVLGFVTLVAKP